MFGRNKVESTSGSSTTSNSSSTSSGDEDSGGDASSSEEFFDAEEPHTGTLIRFSKKILESPPNRVDLTTLTPAEIDSCSSNDYFFVTPPTSSTTQKISLLGSASGVGDNSLGNLNASGLSSTAILSKSEMDEVAEEQRRRKRLEEMRRRLNNDDIEEGPPDEQTSPSDSQTSSVEGLYGAISGKTSHPFKVVDHDSVSLQSGVSSGRVGRPSSTSSTVSSVPNFSGSSMPNNPSSPGGSTSQHNTSSSSSHVPSSPTALQQQQQLTNSSHSSSSIPEENESQVPLSPSSRIGNGNLTRSGNSHTIIPNAEPDLVASCLTKDKANGNVSASTSKTPMPAPVAPPRRKRRGVLSRTQSEEGGGESSSKDSTPLTENASEAFPGTSSCSSSSRKNSASSVRTIASPNPPSPTVSIRSVCRELDKTLEVATAQRICVVKAQDEEKTRAKNSGPKVLRRTESLPKDVIAAFDPTGSGSGGYRDNNKNSSATNSSTSTLNNVNPIGNEDEPPNSNNNSNPTSQQDLSLLIKRHSLSAEKSSSLKKGNNKSNSAPKTGSMQLSSLVSAIAAMEEKKDFEGLANFDMIRTRTDSGKLLSDLEILEQVQVLNLDTGERVPLSIAEDKIPQCINPLSLHIMRLTSEYVGQRNSVDRDSDEESLDSKMSSAASQEDGEISGVKKKTAQVRRFLGSTVRRTVDKAKSLAHRRHVKEDVDISTNEDILLGGGPDPLVKMKASHSHKGPYDFDHLQQVQDLSGEHSGPVWCMKFSNCGRLIATAGQDKIIRIWVLKDHLPYFQDMRTKNTTDKVSPTPSQESIVSQHSQHSAEEMLLACENSDPKSPFVPRPLCTYSGHTADLLDIAWSKSFFLLSSSMDRTVRLWHISRRECLCCFQHIDFVTAIAFHPRDDRYFLSGSLDGKLRLWNIPDKKVALWNEVNGPNNLITAANFCQNGKFAVVGTYDGRCIFYHTEQLKYHTQIIVHRRKRLTGRKITGIEPMPGEDKILVTSNDSRIRLYDLRDLSLTCKYKGFSNSSSQIKGTVSHDGKYIVSGSENQCVYIWKTNHDYSKFSSARRDRNGYWEGIKAHNAVVTCAIFAPDPDIIVKQIEKKEEQEAEKQQVNVGMVKSPSLTKSHSHHQHSSTSPAGYVLVSADFSGCIKVFFSKVKPKHSSLPASALV